MRLFDDLRSCMGRAAAFARTRAGIATFIASIMMMVVADPAKADVVLFKYGLASAEVGLDPTHGPVFRKIWLAAIAPDGAASPPCLSAAVSAAGKSTQDPLDRQVKPWPNVLDEIIARNQDVTSASVAEAEKQRKAAVDGLLADAQKIFHRELARCVSTPGKFRLAVVNRYCVAWGPEACSGRRIVANANLSAARYGKVYEWLVSEGVPAEGEYAPLNDNGAPGPATKFKDLTHESLPTPAADRVQRQFEAGAASLRQAGLKYLYIVPRATHLDKVPALHLIDVIEDPAFAVAPLKDGGKLLQANDELARGRLKECALFRGQVTAIAAARCAGYKVNNASLQECLDGGACAPDFDTNAEATVFAIVKSGSLADIAQNSPLPRIWKAKQTFKQYEDIARTCGQTSNSSVETTHCLLKSQLGVSEQKTLECLNARGYTGVGQCLPDALGNSAQAIVARCMAQAKDGAARALCLAVGSSPEARRVVQCLLASSSAGATVCLASNNLSKDERELADCGVKNGSDYKSMAGCVAGHELQKHIGGDVGRFVSCSAASGGDGITTTACMADVQFTPEQQILLQCASQSPDPGTFALCTGGQLSLREYTKCQHIHFAKGDCFGENNEIRRLSRQLGLGDITDSSVVGQVADGNLQVIKFQVSLAEGTVKAAVDFGNAVGKGVTAIGQGADHAAGEVKKEIQKWTGIQL